MKKMTNLFASVALAAALLLGASACSDDKMKPEDETLDIPAASLSLSFAAEGGAAQTVTVTSNTTWTATPSATWIKVTNVKATSFDVTVDPNTGAERPGSIVVETKLKGQTKTIQITQATAHVPLAVDVTELNFNWIANTAGAKTVNVTSSDAWTATPDAAWITVVPGETSFTVLAADTDAKRTPSSVKVTAGTQEIIIPVTQQLHADDVVGTWASTEILIYRNPTTGVTQAYNNDHEVYITKIDGTTLKVANVMQSSELFSNITVESDTVNATIDPVNGTITIATPQEMIPTIDMDEWPSYMCRYALNPLTENLANTPGFIDFPIAAGFNIDWSVGGYNSGTVSGVPVYATFLPLTQNPDNAAEIYYFGWYTVNSKWLKTGSTVPTSVKKSASGKKLVGNVKTNAPVTAINM